MTSSRLLLALVTLAASSVGFASAEQVIRLSYRFAFEDDGMLDAASEPTKQEVEAVLCQTNVFYSKQFQSTFDNPKLAVVTKEADYAFEDYKFVGDDGTVVEMPANINFTLSVLTTDDSEVPSLSDIQDALPDLDYNAYLTKYVWKAAPVTKNFFFEARGVVWKSLVVDDVKGSISVVNCPKGAQPEAMVGVGKSQEAKKEIVNGTDFSASNGFSLEMGFSGGKLERPPTDMEWEALICKLDQFVNGELKTKLHDPSILSYSSAIHWEYNSAAYLPAQVNFSIAAFFGNETEVPAGDLFHSLELRDTDVANLASQYINKAFPEGFNVFAQVDAIYFRGASIRESDPETTLAKANCPVTVHVSDLPYFELQFEFDEDVEKQPTREEIEAMICEANKFFQSSIRETFNDTSMVSHATNIDWTYDAAEQYSSIVSFTSLTMNGDGSHARAKDVYEAMQLADVQKLTEQYLLNAVPFEQNIFYFAKNLYFTGSLGKVVENAKIPEGVPCQAFSDTRLPAFLIKIGFDTRTGIPTEQDVKGLICQTNKYFEDRLRQELVDEDVNSHATNIDWDYVPGDKLPARVNFTAFTTYKDGTLVPGKLVYDILKVIDVETYVRNYAWNSEPYETNIFWDIRDIEFSGEVNAPVREGKLDRATCVPPGLAGGKPETPDEAPQTAEKANEKIETSEPEKRVTHLSPHE